MTIEINQLVKDYGKFRALDHLTLSIGQGMFGLLGPNGAGKTTLMKIMTTLLQPTAGSVVINGHDVQQNPQAIRRDLGFVPQYFGFYKGLNAYETLDYIAIMKDVPRRERKEQITRLLNDVNLTDDAKRKVGGYSGGMRQRLAIAQALLGDPSVLVVDEPTAGLDPEERIRFRNLLTRLADDRIIILSTHIVADIEASCESLAVINKGQLVYQGNPQSLVERAMNTVWEISIDPSEYDAMETQYNVVSSRSANQQLHLRIITNQPPESAQPIAPTLEDGYMAVMYGIQAETLMEVSYA